MPFSSLNGAGVGVQFRFNERKAAQAAAYLLRKSGGARTYGELVKLLYLADRRKLIERGTPITGDRLVSMPHGTAVSIVLEIIKEGGSGDAGEIFNDYVSRPQALEVRALRDDTDELSEYERCILDETFAQFGKLNFAGLRKVTHALPEWEDPHDSSKIIPPERILECEGRSSEEVSAATENADALLALDRFLAR